MCPLCLISNPQRLRIWKSSHSESLRLMFEARSLTTISRETGIYEIRCISNNKVYIGSTTVSFRGRLQRHVQELCRGTHHCKQLQRCWNKYGEANFSFKILEFVPRKLGETEKYFKKRIETREQAWIDSSSNHRLNTAPVAGNCLGVKHGEEHRRKTSEGMKRFCSSPEVRLRRSSLMKLVYQTNPELKGIRSRDSKINWSNPEYRKRLTAVNRARQTPERRADQANKMRQKWQEPEHRAKVAASQAPVMNSPEYRAKLSVTSKQRWQEQREKMMDARNRGCLSPEARAKASAALSQVWQQPGYKERTVANIVKSRASKCQPIVLISRQGTKFVTDNQAGFAKQYELSPKTLTGVISGKVPSHRGWTGYRLESWTDIPKDAIRVLWGEHPELMEQEKDYCQLKLF